eukprot:scaffold6.g2665.t1
MAACYPPSNSDAPGGGVLSPEEQTDVAFCSFPDSLSFELQACSSVRDSSFFFKIRRRGAEGPRPGFLYGYVVCRQRLEESMPRGGEQRSVVVLSALPLSCVLRPLSRYAANAVFGWGPQALAGVWEEVQAWPPLELGAHVALPLGPSSCLSVDLPEASTLPVGCLPQGGLMGALVDELDPDTGLPLCLLPQAYGQQEPVLGPFADHDVYTPFRSVLESLWALWELVLLGEPLLVMAPTPGALSHVLSPYLTIHDPAWAALSSGVRPDDRNGLPALLGATNLHFLRALPEAWSVLSTGFTPSTWFATYGSAGPGGLAAQPGDSSGGGSANAKAAAGGGGRRAGLLARRPAQPQVLLETGVDHAWLAYRPLSRPDGALLANLVHPSPGEPPDKQRRMAAVNSTIFRRHFEELTRALLFPLLPYITPAHPPPPSGVGGGAAPVAPPALPELRPAALLTALADRDARLPEVLIARFGGQRGVVAFYERLLTAHTFQSWLEQRRAVARRWQADAWQGAAAAVALAAVDNRGVVCNPCQRQGGNGRVQPILAEGAGAGRAAIQLGFLPELPMRSPCPSIAVLGMPSIALSFPSGDNVRLLGLVAAGTAVTAGAVLLTRRLLAKPRALDISSLEELEVFEEQGAVVALLTAHLGSSTVRLSGLGAALAALPPSVLRLRASLQELELNNNAISAVPDGIGHLVGLNRLFLAGNAIEALPDAIGMLVNLVDLDLSNNRLVALPDSIASLASLKYLNCMGNRLEALPDSIGSLANLYRLGLKSNRLTSLPASIGNLASLVELFITDNRLEALPKEMGKLFSLASFNKLRSLPAELAGLSNLELLRVACCELEETPAVLKGMPKLAWFSISGNPCCPVKSPRTRVPTVPISDVAVGRKLGDGASGEVFEAVWQGERVALKGDPNLVKVLGKVENPLGLLMEFAEGQPLALKPNLESLLRCRWAPATSFKLEFILRVGHGLAGALEHMHYRGICHGDVYAHNLLVDADASSVILCDYGAAFPYHKNLPIFGGLAAYEAGEVRALGLLLADMVQRLEMDFEGMDAIIECQRELLQLIQLCTTSAPAKRPCFGTVGKKLRAIQRHLERDLHETPRADSTADSVRSMDLAAEGGAPGKGAAAAAAANGTAA